MPEVVISVAIGLLVSTVLGTISRALSPKPKKQGIEEKGRKQVIRSSVEAHQIVYGTSMESGPLVFGETTGTNDELLHLVIPLAAHEVQAIDSVWLSDVEITSGQLDGSGNVTSGFYANKVQIKKHLGSDTQVADSSLVFRVDNWTTNHRGRGIAYLYLRLEGDIEVFATGIPNVRAVLRGRKVWDPRSDPGDPSVRTFSNNAALCQLDYLMSDFGFAVPLAEINEASWIAAANVSDESVTLKAGGSQSRYTCDGSFQVDRKPAAIMDELLTASAGAMVYQQGTFRGYAGAATTATNTLDESDLRGPISPVTPRPSISEAFNAIRGTFVDADDVEAPFSLTEFPPITNATFESEDNGERVFSEIELPFTTNKARAQRIANLFLLRARQGITFTFPAKLTKLEIAAWDVVAVTIARLGWSSKEFRVLQWELSEDGGVNLTLQEEAAAVYTFDPDDEITVDPAPDTNLPDPFSTAPPLNLNLDSSESQLFLNKDGTLIPRILATWDASGKAFVNQYEIQWRNVTKLETFQTFAMVAADNREVFINPAVQGDSYDIRVRSINSLSVKSDFVTVTGHIVIGKSSKPPDVTSLFLNIRTLSWSYPNPPFDLDGFLVRSRPGTIAFWSDATPLHDGVVTDTEFDIGDLQGGSLALMVKAIDNSGNESVNPATIIKDIGDPLVDNVVVTVDRHAAGFPGTITNGTVNGGTGDLEADDSGTLFWAVNDASPLWTGDNKLFWTDTFLQMTYDTTFTPEASITGSDVIATLLLTVQAEAWSISFRAEGSQFWDEDSTLLFWKGDDVDNFWEALPSFSTWPGSISPVLRQDYEFRLVTDAAALRGIISRYIIQADVPDLIETLNDIAIGAGGTRLPLTKNFRGIQNVLVTVQDDGGSAVGMKVLDKSLIGPLIETLNASGTAVSGNVDAQVQGF